MSEKHSCPQSKHTCSVEASLQEIFHCLVEMKHQTQLAHWMVGGPHFSSWHEMYGAHYEQLNKITDDFVEMILMHDLALTDCPPSSHTEITQHGTMGSKKHMEELMIHGKQLLHLMETMLKKELSSSMNDMITEDIRILEKQLWFYKSSLMS